MGGTVDGIEWLGDDAALVALACPNCADVGGKRPVLQTGWPGQAAKAVLLRCQHCDGGFFDPVAAADYGAAPTGGEAALAFYLQQGAGLWGITGNLAALGRPPGTRLLEVGCGFGFGLDFARRALGWQVLGLDPAPFAAEGRRQLDLPIEQRYLAADDPVCRGQFDVVMASEVIEHVARPGAFARTLYDALRDGGTLVLTTPDLDAARPDTPRGLLVPLLSVGYHLVLQSAASLEWTLREAGFTAISVSRNGGASLVAQAQRGDAAMRPEAPEPDSYGRYLRAASRAAAPDGDLWFGLVARAYRLAVNGADRPGAAAGWADFAAACRRRFDLDVDAPAAPGDLSLEQLARREPLCLGPVLLHRALHRLLLGEARTVVEPVFAAAAGACDRLRAALQRIGSDDGDAEDVAWVARAEAILCAAERGAAGVPERLAELGRSPNPTARGRTASFERRAFTALVNAGRLEDAGRLTGVARDVSQRWAQGAVLAGEELDVLYSAAVRALQIPGGSAAEALALLQALEAACDASRAAGQMAGPAVSLAAPIRDAQVLALEVLGQHAAAAAAALRRAPLAARRP